MAAFAYSALESDHGAPFDPDERRSLEFVEADGWRGIFPLTSGHLTAAEARAIIREERGLPRETRSEAREADRVLADAGAAPSGRTFASPLPFRSGL